MSDPGGHGQQGKSLRGLMDEINAGPPPAKTNPDLRSAPSSSIIPLDSRGIPVPAPAHRIRTDSNSPEPPIATEFARRQAAELAEERAVKQARMAPAGPEPVAKQPTYGMPRKVPECFVQANKEDQMLWSWALDEEKSWNAICDEWRRLTGYQYPVDSSEPSYWMEVRTLREQLMVRHRKLIEVFSASGTLQLPDWWYQKFPSDRKYKIISDRKVKDVEMIEVVKKATEEIDDIKWATVKRIYKDELEKDVDVKELKRRFEMLKNGGASTQEPDSDEGEDMDDDYYDEAEDGDLEDYDDGEGDEDVDEDGAEEDVPVVKDEDEA